MVFYSENIEDMDFYFTNNETNENPIDLGLTDLVSYSVNTQHSIEHVKVIYDLKKIIVLLMQSYQIKFCSPKYRLN